MVGGLAGGGDPGHRRLHIAMFPWLATGHITPFFHLAKRLSRDYGHKVSFLSTPGNLRRLTKLPPALTSLITTVPIPFPETVHIPPHAESTADLPSIKQPLIKNAYDCLRPAVQSFLKSAKPDWIIYDFASPWLPPLAVELGIHHAFFCVFNAAILVFMGSPESLLDPPPSRRTLEGYTVAPEWVPFESDVVAFRPYEMKNFAKYHKSAEYTSDTSDAERWGITLRDCEVIAVRTCPGLEEEWCGLLQGLHRKPVFPIGLLPPELEEEEDDEKWEYIKGWLDKQVPKSVVYVALGTETALREEEARELAKGLDESGMQFLWVLRDPPEFTKKAVEMLPPEFMSKVEEEGKGLVYTGWAPQARILSHGAVGGFVTHCGMNSVIEGLSLGKALILLPMMNEQGNNARLLVSKKLGKRWRGTSRMVRSRPGR
ncbi:hypothetical protein MLD38_001699 [Melastoma candidum]|uniref:Uncharacterized protein n=1 Tax=Melastoma candidum TaxID=119954 RepID=A0ACB9SIZ8_9MYRT|nr:hypothetical protein MLD38_001699 [Melastoma candidum]